MSLKKLSKINRVRNYRKTKKEFLRLDMAEKLDNYNKIFFNTFLKKLSQEDFITYPSYQEYEQLIKKIAKLNSCSSSNIYFDTGSDACIKNFFQVFLNKKDEILITQPSFPMYSVYAEGFELKIKKIKFNNKNEISIESICNSISSKTKVVILANPNSPYGDYKNKNEISKLLKFLKKKNINLILDEAYVEFSKGSMIDLLDRYSNLFILRTFSKAWGAAGCRVGYIISNEKNIEYLLKTQITFPITCVSVKFITYLIDNKKYIFDQISQSIKDRDIFCNLLEANNFDVIRSSTNSIHFHEKNSDNSRIVKILNKHKVGFKYGSNIGTPIFVAGDKRKTWIRISVGKNIHKTKYIKEILKL